MNIFILDVDPLLSAQYHTDKHCVKMILEQCQMLCAAVSLNNQLHVMPGIAGVPYKLSHPHHPCTVWVATSYENYSWLVSFTHKLHEEYKYRYGREHLSYTKLRQNFLITDKLISDGQTLCIIDLAPVAVMPDGM